MQSIWHSLSFKEWHEHKWKLASLAAILLGVACFILRDATKHGFDGIITDADAFFQFRFSVFVFAVPAALFIGMGVAGGERSAGTFEFLCALPIPPWKIAVVKLSVGCLAVVVPVAITTLVIMAWFSILDASGTPLVAAEYPFRVNHYSATAYAGLTATACAVQVLLWCAAAGINQSTEVRAGVAGIALLLTCGAVIWCIDLIGNAIGGRFEGLSAIPIWVSPFGLLTLLHPQSPRWLVLLMQLLATGCVVSWFIRSFGKQTSHSAHFSAGRVAPRADKHHGLCWGRQSVWSALAWKQMREARPFCVAGLVFIASATVLFVAPFVLEKGAARQSGATAEVFRNCFAGLGLLVAVVIGIGTFVSDLQPQLLAFWRSRPINPSQWFWVKYPTSALTMVLFLQGPVLLIHLCFPWFTGSAFAIVPYLVCVSLLHLTAFGIAVCLTCVLRQTVYAGILAVGAILSLIALPEIVPSFSWLSIGSVLFSLNHTEYLDIRAWFIGFYLPFLSVMAAMLVPLALIAWLAVRFDLGRRA